MTFFQRSFAILAMTLMLSAQIRANTMWMTRGSYHQSEDIVGDDGTSEGYNLNFQFDYKNVSTDPASGSSTGDRPSFRVKVRYDGTGSTSGSVGDDVTEPGLVLDYDQKNESYPESNGVPLELILHDGTAATTLASTTVDWDNQWHRIAIQWDASAATATVTYDGVTLFNSVSVSTSTYDMTGRNFVINGLHRLADAGINFDNITVNGVLLEDFESLTAGADVTGDWVVYNSGYMDVNGDEDGDYFVQPPAFPGAEGFGAYANGGRGGDVYVVTTTEDDVEGSLRYGIDNAPAGGRTIVFAVSGYIEIGNDSTTGDKTLLIDTNNVTIAGQTAPGDGIGLKDGRIYITGTDSVVRNLRIRHGKYGGAGDCVNIAATAQDTMLDHLTLMFSTDENISFFSSAIDDFTMQWSTSSWGMERHNAGGLWDLEDGTCHHTLWANHRTRNPKARPYGLLEWTNNVTYHYRSEGFIMGDSETNTDWYANVEGCYFISIGDFEFNAKNYAFSKGRIASDLEPNFHLYLNDCLFDNDEDGVLNGTDQGYGIVSGTPYTGSETVEAGDTYYYQASAPFDGAPVAVTVDDPLTAYKKVISASGAVRLDASDGVFLRDELDTLLIDSIVDQESILVAKDSPVLDDAPASSGEALLASDYGITNSGFGTLEETTGPTDTDVDGMPDYWETALGSDPGAQDHNTSVGHDGSVITAESFFPDDTAAGYNLLEEYLYFCSIPHATMDMNVSAQVSSLSVDLSAFTCGFTSSPVFTLSDVYGGTATLSGSTVTFTPTLNAFGRAGFNFNVTDADGSSWTQPFAILVDATAEIPELCLHYEMEDDVTDSSGNGNDGTAAGSPVYDEGIIDQAIDLDGSDDLVTIPSGVADCDDITVSTWIYWDGGDNWQRIFDLGTGTSQYLFLTPSSGDSTLRFAIKDGGDEQIVETTALTTDEWVHLAVTLDGDLATLYVNGEAAAANSAVTIDPGDFNPAVNYIGDSQFSADPFFDGRIDDFRIYNYALTAAEVADLYADTPANAVKAEIWMMYR